MAACTFTGDLAVFQELFLVGSACLGAASTVATSAAAASTGIGGSGAGRAGTTSTVVASASTDSTGVGSTGAVDVGGCTSTTTSSREGTAGLLESKSPWTVSPRDVTLPTSSSSMLYTWESSAVLLQFWGESASLTTSSSATLCEFFLCVSERVTLHAGERVSAAASCRSWFTSLAPAQISTRSGREVDIGGAFVPTMLVTSCSVKFGTTRPSQLSSIGSMLRVAALNFL